MTRHKLKLTKPSTIRLLYQMMYDIHRIFTNNKLTYWADGGTFLGATRHEGIIPWDDDLDIGIFEEDKRKFIALRGALENCGYSVIRHWVGFKIFYTDRTPIEDFDYSFPFCDVFIYRLMDGKYRQTSKQARETWPNAYFLPEELGRSSSDAVGITPLQTLPFGEFKITCANNADRYFETLYGSDWNKVAYRQYDHSVEEEVESVKVNLTKEMRKPAQPTAIKNRKCASRCLSPTARYRSPQRLLKQETKRCVSYKECRNNFDFEMPVFVINCAMHIDRLAKFNAAAKIAGLNVCRQPCVLGRKFTDELICAMRNQKLLAKKTESEDGMTPIEVSINLSHFNCWRQIVNSCADYGMVMEDDLEVHSNFISMVNQIMSKLDEKDMLDFSILHLWNGNWMETARKHKKIAQVSRNIEIMQETKPYNAGAVCYIISRKYAIYLMKRMFPIKLPQDILMGDYPTIGKHLTLKMTHRNDCYISPMLKMNCGGEYGTGNSTQERDIQKMVEDVGCDVCKF